MNTKEIVEKLNDLESRVERLEQPAAGKKEEKASKPEAKKEENKDAGHSSDRKPDKKN